MGKLLLASPRRLKKHLFCSPHEFGGARGARRAWRSSRHGWCGLVIFQMLHQQYYAGGCPCRRALHTHHGRPQTS
eukprot:1181529-Amphidinium_carterae.3